jgi:hypothetical protein
MKDLQSNVLKLIYVFALLVLNSCGGGTSGTGNPGSKQLISGIVRDQLDQPLPNVKITVINSKSSAETDATGRFEIVNEQVADNLILLVDYNNFTSQVPINNIPSETENIDIDIQVDQTGLITILSLSFDETPITTSDPTNETPNGSDPKPEEPEPNNPDAKPDYQIIWSGSVTLQSTGMAAKNAIMTLLPYQQSKRINSTGTVKFTTKNNSQNATIKIQYNNHFGSIQLKKIPQNKNLEIKFALSIDDTGVDTAASDTPLNLMLDSYQIRKR